MSAYYSENDPFAAAWLRELIKAGHIEQGEIDERSIVDVQPSDLRGFDQCHFFAGIGGWAYALRAAGWPGDTPVWTGSCPCQSFSQSGNRGGFDDPRHLWPAWFRLIQECRPDVIFGEQVASQDGLAWLDVVSADMEEEGYAIGAADICAAGFGAPHIRQRLYFVADSGSERKHALLQREGRGWKLQDCAEVDGRSETGELADSGCIPSERWGIGGELDSKECREGQSVQPTVKYRSEVSILADTADIGCGRASEQPGPAYGGIQKRSGDGSSRGFWTDADWLPCRDGKVRPVSTQPEIFPLASGITNRVGLLRGAGNAINAEVAKGFIEAYLETS